ncbi:MAG: hypothetical protein ABH951_01370 [Patescibacteria group bacterium]
MSLEDRDKISGIERLKNKLFSKDYKSQVEHITRFSNRLEKDIPVAWENFNTKRVVLTEKILTKNSVFKKFFVFAIFFFVLALAYAGYMVFIGGNTVSNNNIDVVVLGNAFTAGGEELPLQIEITNKNNSDLLLADLLIEYPKNSSGDLTKDTERIRESLGTISAGGIRSENVKVVIFGEQGSIRPIKISLEYRIEGSNSIFVKEKIYEVSISSAPINLSIEAPNEASPGQDVTFKVKVSLNATSSASNILMKVDYPIGFEFDSAIPATAFGNNVWTLGDIAPGVERVIAISGKMTDVFDGEEKIFHIFSGSQSSSDKSLIGIIFNSLSHSVLIKKPFIEAKLFINNIYEREYAVNSKDLINAQIGWTNNLNTKVNDLEITAKISGNVVNRKSISAQSGFYESSSDTISWNKNTQYSFAEVNPGESGSVSFSLNTLPLFSSVGGIISNPSFTIDISISGKQPLEGNASQKLVNSESKVIKVTSDVGFANKILYFSGPFPNTGSIPPKIDQETTYTVVWAISNTSNNLSKVQIKSSLPLWARFVGNISPPSEDVTFNSSTRELVWNVGSIPRGSGISQEGREVAFQIAFTPSLSQIGTVPILINNTTLYGHDDFTNLDIKVYKNSLNTRLPNDASFPSGGEVVIE